MKKGVLFALLIQMVCFFINIVPMDITLEHTVATSVNGENEALKKKKCANLICIFDSLSHETLSGNNYAMVKLLMAALEEKIAPIIITANIVEHFCYWKTHQDEVMHNANLKTISAQIMATDFNDKDWDCYAHKHTGLILLMPKKYLATHAKNKKSSIQDHMEQCGFDVSNLDKIDDVSPVPILHYIQTHKREYANLVDNFASIFIKNKNQLPYILQWNIYVTGHGVSAPIVSGESLDWERKKLLRIISKYERELQEREDVGTSAASGETGEDVVSKKMKKLEELKQDLKRLETVGVTQGEIAGLRHQDFLRLIAFFDKGITTSYLDYNSCYSGGSNQALVNQELSEMNVSFIVSAYGINETSVASILNERQFTQFFTLLEDFFCDRVKFVKDQRFKKDLQKDPIAAIVSAVTSNRTIDQNQPFVRIPGVGVFNALSVDKQVKILTKTIAKSYELAGTAIDFTDPHIKTVFVYPSYVGASLKIRNHVAIVSPSPQLEIKPTETIHVFEEIFYNDLLSSVIPNFVSFNTRYEPILFVIKKLHCLDYENSGLAVGNKKPITIENMIIRIASVKRPNVHDLDVVVDVLFSRNNMNYSMFQEIKELQSYKEPNIAKMFTAFSTGSVSTVVPDDFITLAEKIVGKQVAEKLENKEAALSFIVKELEKKTGREIQEMVVTSKSGKLKTGTLKYALLLKKLDSLERAVAPQALNEQKIWLKKNNKAATVLVDNLKKRMNETEQLQQQINQLTGEEMAHLENAGQLQGRASDLNIQQRIALVRGILMKEYEHAVAQLTFSENLSRSVVKPISDSLRRGGSAVIKRVKQVSPAVKKGAVKYENPR